MSEIISTSCRIFDEKFILLAENLDNRSANITNFLQAFTNQKFNLETIDNLSNFMFIVYGNTSYSAQLKFKYFIETKFRNEYVEPTPDSIKIAKLSELFDQKNLSSNNEKYLRVYPKINVNSLAQQILERVEFLMSKTPVL